MGTRCGSLDPGVVLFMMDELALGPREIERLIYHESGLLGMSGVSSDVRDLLASNDPAAAAALDVFVYRAGRELGSLAAALGGLDAIVFTAGIGENQPEIRARICRDGRLARRRARRGRECAPRAAHLHAAEPRAAPTSCPRTRRA